MAEIIPYEIELNDQPFWVVGSTLMRESYLAEHSEVAPKDLGIIALGIFRTKSYIDYAAIGRVDDIEGEIGWTRAYEAYEWVDWLAGFVYRQPERNKQLHATQRKLGRFLLKFGWAPDAVLESEPNENEIEGYINHIVSKDEVDGYLMVPEDD